MIVNYTDFRCQSSNLYGKLSQNVRRKLCGAYPLVADRRGRNEIKPVKHAGSSSTVNFPNEKNKNRSTIPCFMLPPLRFVRIRVGVY